MVGKSKHFSTTLVLDCPKARAPKWKYVKDRAFLYGNVLHDILTTIISLNPN